MPHHWTRRCCTAPREGGPLVCGPVMTHRRSWWCRGERRPARRSVRAATWPPALPPVAPAGLFIIGPDGRLRQKTVNDLPVGRSGEGGRGLLPRALPSSLPPALPPCRVLSPATGTTAARLRGAVGPRSGPPRRAAAQRRRPARARPVLFPLHPYRRRQLSPPACTGPPRHPPCCSRIPPLVAPPLHAAPRSGRDVAPAQGVQVHR